MQGVCVCVCKKKRGGGGEGGREKEDTGKKVNKSKSFGIYHII